MATSIIKKKPIYRTKISYKVKNYIYQKDIDGLVKYLKRLRYPLADDLTRALLGLVQTVYHGSLELHRVRAKINKAIQQHNDTVRYGAGRKKSKNWVKNNLIRAYQQQNAVENYIKQNRHRRGKDRKGMGWAEKLKAVASRGIPKIFAHALKDSFNQLVTQGVLSKTLSSRMKDLVTNLIKRSACEVICEDYPEDYTKKKSWYSNIPGYSAYQQLAGSYLPTIPKRERDLSERGEKTASEPFQIPWPEIPSWFSDYIPGAVKDQDPINIDDL